MRTSVTDERDEDQDLASMDQVQERKPIGLPLLMPKSSIRPRSLPGTYLKNFSE